MERPKANAMEAALNDDDGGWQGTRRRTNKRKQLTGYVNDLNEPE